MSDHFYTEPERPRSQQPRSSSTFSRIASNLSSYVAAPPSASSVGSHSSGPNSLASASSSQFNINTAVSASASASAAPTSAARSAFGALEALQTADFAAAERKGEPGLIRPGSSRLRTESASSSPARGRRGPGTSRERAPFGRTASQPGSTSRGNSPAGVAAPSSSHPHDWGDQVLPPNANPAWLGPRHALSSAPDDANASGFPGASGFSFEHLGGESYRGSLGGSSSSLIRDFWPSSFGASGLRLPASIPASGSRFEGVGGVSGVSGASWAEGSTSARVGAAGPGRGMAGFSAAVGGGGRKKESSRGMRYGVQTLPRDPRGVVGISQPKEGERGRVAVAGKTYLRVLRVPHGERSPSPTYNRRPSPSPGAIGSFRTSSLATRRSHSRGSASPLDRISDDDGRSAYARDGDDEIVETMDVRTGSRLGPSNLFTDVNWGYAATSNKLATSLTNGAVALWDLGKEGGNKLETVKYEHDKAVNKVVFGGQSGSWIMSGGNDGQMKLWDIRNTQTSSMILKAASPVRQLAFSPSAAQPFTLLACCASGLLLRYDLRNLGRGGQVSATDRIVGHVGSVLALSWRDNLPGETVTAGGRGEGGWVVTGGMDRSIKVWDFGQPTLAAKPVRTLWASQPVQSLAWHPTRHTELASSPLPTLAQESVHDDATSPGGTAGLGLGAAAASIAAAADAAHKNEIEVWDITRPFFPKYSIKTDEPTAQLVYNDSDTLWAGSKASSAFSQYDVAADSYTLLDNVARPGPTWNAEGELAFVDDGRHSLDRSWPLEPVSLAGTAVPQFKPANVLCSLYDPDPDFDPAAFAFLAENLVVSAGRGFGEACEANAQVSQLAARPDAAQFWLALKLWLDVDPAFCGPDSPPLTPPSEGRAVTAKASAPLVAHRVDEWALPPPAGAPGGGPPEPSLARTSASVPPRRSFSASLGMRRTSTSSPVVGPTELPKLPLDYFSEESSSNEASDQARGRSRGGSGEARVGAAAGGGHREAVVSTSSESEHDLPSHFRHINSGSNGGSSSNLRLQRSATTGSNSRRSGRGRSSTLLGEERLLPDGTSPGATSDAEDGLDLGAGPLHSRRSSATALNSLRPSSGSDSDADSEAEDRLRESRLGTLQSALASRRGSSLGGDRKAAIAAIAVDSALARAAFLGSRDSRRGSLDGVNMSRRGSLPLVAGRSGTRDRQTTGGSVGPPAPAPPAGPSRQELNRREAHKLAAEAAELVKRQIQDALQAYADRGDSQLCAIAACVLQGHVELAPLFVARVSKAYVGQLRRLDLHAAAAMVVKHCATDSIRASSQNMVTWHTACGQCGKAHEAEPFGVCRRCRALATQCVLCHLPVRTLLVFCAGCGHGAHAACLATYAHSLSALKSQTALPSASASHPSTPGLVGPVKSWLWGEPSSAAVSPAGEGGPGGQGLHWVTREGVEQGILQTCPHGMCGHAGGCVLSEVGV